MCAPSVLRSAASTSGSWHSSLASSSAVCAAAGNGARWCPRVKSAASASMRVSTGPRVAAVSASAWAGLRAHARTHAHSTARAEQSTGKMRRWNPHAHGSTGGCGTHMGSALRGRDPRQQLGTDVRIAAETDTLRQRPSSVPSLGIVLPCVPPPAACDGHRTHCSPASSIERSSSMRRRSPAAAAGQPARSIQHTAPREDGQSASRPASRTLSPPQGATG
jgi:hypothetical protein